MCSLHFGRLLSQTLFFAYKPEQTSTNRRVAGSMANIDGTVYWVTNAACTDTKRTVTNFTPLVLSDKKNNFFQDTNRFIVKPIILDAIRVSILNNTKGSDWWLDFYPKTVSDGQQVLIGSIQNDRIDLKHTIGFSKYYSNVAYNEFVQDALELQKRRQEGKSGQFERIV